MKTTIFLLLLIPLAAAAAQAYKVVRPDGTVEFTDQDVKGAEEIILPGAQGYQLPAAASPAQPGTTGAPAAPAATGNYQQFAISMPAAEATVQHNGGNVAVAVAVDPALQPGHQVVITLDGSEVARGPASSFTLSGVERGAHQLGATLIDAAGSVVRTAPPQTFYVFQRSAINPP